MSGTLSTILLVTFVIFYQWPAAYDETLLMVWSRYPTAARKKLRLGNVHGKMFSKVFGLYNDYNQSKCSMSKPVDFPVNDDGHWLTFASYGNNALFIRY